MNEKTPDETPRSGQPVPDPHAGEPAPTPHEGRRPEADPSVVRPEEDEPNGIVGGLLNTAGAEVKQRYTDDPGAEATAQAAGVEEEGIESGQIFGLFLATALAVIVLVITVYYLFYSPALQETRDAAADVPQDRYVELREARASAAELTDHYALNADGTYRMPIGDAMSSVAQEYATRQTGATALDPQLDGLTWLTLTPAAAVRSLDAAAAPNEPAEPGQEAAATPDEAAAETAAPVATPAPAPATTPAAAPTQTP